MPPYERRRTGRPPPHSTPRHTTTHVSAYTPLPRYIPGRYDTRIPICHRRQCVSCIRSRGTLDLFHLYDAGASRGRREAGRYVCCWCGVVWDVDGGGGLSVRRHSYRGHRVVTMEDRKTIESQADRQLECTWALSGKNRHNASKTNGRARGVRCVFYLILVLPVFGPKRTRCA